MESSIQKNISTYSSKLLLFGEYTILSGSKSLAIPFNQFSLRLIDNGRNNFEDYIKVFYNYLCEQDFTDYGVVFDSEKYRAHFKNGLFIESDIPFGYGIGSSGAVTAAVFDHFFQNNNNKIVRETSVLKKILSKIENFFHGKSSGIDPLIIYLNQAFISLPEGGIQKFEFDPSVFKDQQVKLIDSEISRKTSKFVEIFYQKLNDLSFIDKYLQPLIALNDGIIDDIVSQQHLPNLFDRLKRISELQFLGFSEMIPESIYTVWKKSLDDEKHVIKLCGAGGGGFFYLFSNSPGDFKSLYPSAKLIHIKL